MTTWAVEVDPRISVHPLALVGLPPAQEFEIYRMLGVSRIGVMATAAAADEDRVSTTRRSGLEVGYTVFGGTAPVDDDDAWRAERRALLAAVEVTQRLAAPMLYVTTGRSGSLRYEAALRRWAERLAPVVDAARAAGIQICLENTASIRSDISFVHTVRDALAAAEAADLGLCVDIYNCWQEPGLADTLARGVDRIGLAQLADFRSGTLTFPNRWVPGDGDIPLESLLHDLLTCGYAGPIDLEVFGPAIDAEGPGSALRRCVGWLDERLRGPHRYPC